MASFEELSLVLLSSTKSEGSEIDLTALVETYSTLLFRVAYSVLRSSAEAEDVVQETFLRTLQHRGTLPAVRDMRVWLTRIAWNLAIDRRRRKRPDQMDQAFADSLVAVNQRADQMLGEAQQLSSTRLKDSLAMSATPFCSPRSKSSRPPRSPPSSAEPNPLSEPCSSAPAPACAKG